MRLPGDRRLYTAPCHMGHVEVGPNDHRKDAPHFKENGKIKMKEVFKDYGTLWKVELEPAKVNIQKKYSEIIISLAITSRTLIGYYR